MMAEKCSVREGMFVVPCDTLNKMIDGVNDGKSKAKGIFAWTYVNMQTHEPSRSFIGAKSLQYPKGLVFNFCPFCGEKIDDPAVADS